MVSVLLSRNGFKWIAVLLCCLATTFGAIAAEKGKSEPAPKTKATTKAKPKAKKPAAPKADEAPPHPSKLGWNLRGKVDITLRDATFTYSLENAEWMLAKKDGTKLIDNVGMQFLLADGTVVNVVEFDKGEFGFERPETPLGPCRRYWVEPKPRNGLLIRHTVDLMGDWPCMLIYADIKNVGDKPVAVKQVTPVVTGPGGITNVGGEPAYRHLARRGLGVYDPAAPPRFALFNDAARKTLLALGVFPSECAPGTIDLKRAGEAWHARVTEDFAPAYVLEPGETLRTTPVWFTFFADNATDVDAFFAAGMNALPRPKPRVPDAWVTVPADAPLQALNDTVAAWGKSKMSHALVSAVWAGDAGFDAKNAAATLKGLKMNPGLTVDPSAFVGAEERLTVTTADHKRTLNLALPEARDYAAARLKQAVDWGYAFFVVAPVSASDEALAAMGLSRGQADADAFDLVVAAVGDRPVLPAAAAMLGADLDEWLQAAANTACMARFGGGAGPVRVDAAKLGEPSEALALAMSLYGGPIELVGAPAGGVPSKLKALFPRAPVYAHALDYDLQVPKLWQVRTAGKGGPKDAVAVFPGGRAWTPEELDPPSGGPVRTLRVEGGDVVESKD